MPFIRATVHTTQKRVGFSKKDGIPVTLQQCGQKQDTHYKRGKCLQQVHPLSLPGEQYTCTQKGELKTRHKMGELKKMGMGRMVKVGHKADGEREHTVLKGTAC